MKLFLVFFIALFMGLFSHAQFSDLGTLSDGDLIHFQPILDNDEKLFGYLVIYDLGMTGDETRKFEYIFLDKNLNEVSSKEYEGNKLVQYYYGRIADNNEFLIIPKYRLSKRKDRKLSAPETLILDMKNNTLKTKVYTCYTEDGFEDCETYEKSFEERADDIDEERKKNGFVYKSQVRELKNGGFLVYDYKDVGKNSLKSYTA